MLGRYTLSPTLPSPKQSLWPRSFTFHFYSCLLSSFQHQFNWSSDRIAFPKFCSQSIMWLQYQLVRESLPARDFHTQYLDGNTMSPKTWALFLFCFPCGTFSYVVGCLLPTRWDCSTEASAFTAKEGSGKSSKAHSPFLWKRGISQVTSSRQWLLACSVRDHVRQTVWPGVARKDNSFP